MIGIGLGGFMDGFEKSQKLKQSWADANLKKADAERKKVLQEREDVEYNRVLDQRNASDKLAKDFQAEFDQKVKSGILTDDDFGNAYNKGFVQPRIKQLQLNGDIEGASKFQKWADDENTKTGSRAFMNSLRLFTMGDVDGGLDWLNKGAQTPGYFGEGYNFSKVAQGTNPYTGNPGVTLQINRPDGEPITQTFDVKDIPKFVAGNFSPDAASSWAKQQEEARKQASELDTYEKKKKIDQQFGVGPTKDRAAAIKSLEKEYVDPTGKVTLYGLPKEEQEKLINERVALIRGDEMPGVPGGAPSRPEKKVLFDNTTGKIVDPKTVPASRPAPASAKEESAPKKEEPSWMGSLITGITGRASEGLARERQRFRDAASENSAPAATRASPEQVLQQANAAIENGASVEDVATGLQQAGVPEWQWPTVVQEQLRARQRAYGLNP